MTQAVKQTISALVQMANVDGDLHPRELSFIYGVGLRKGLDVDSIGDIIEAPDPLIAMSNLNEADKVNLMSDVLRLMLVDGRVLPREISFCLEISERLGFASEGVQELIDELSAHAATDEQVIKDRLAAIAGGGK